VTTSVLEGVSVELNDEGFFTDPHQWTESMVPDLALLNGVGPLTDRHYEVIRFMRAQYDAKGEAPSVRALSKMAGVPIKELYELFPKGPAKTAAKLAGVPKPRGCI
jgi:TusE/DsrC/DsvC family sulfur relay protein